MNRSLYTLIGGFIIGVMLAIFHVYANMWQWWVIVIGTYPLFQWVINKAENL